MRSEAIKYKVERLVRTVGDHVQVFEALQPDIGRKVEIRLLNFLLEEGSDESQRFEREFKAIARLDHPGLVKVYDWGVTQGKMFYVTECKGAPTLAQLVGSGRVFGQEDVLHIGVELCGALAYLHAKGLIHRGLTLEGVLYREDPPMPIVSDFAVIKDIHGEDLTARGVKHLAPLQVTPEVLAGKTPDKRVDLYLLGSVLYRLLAPGEDVVFAEDGSGLRFRPLDVVSPQTHEAVVRPIMRALSADPEDRQGSAEEFRANLRVARESLRRPALRKKTKAPQSLATKAIEETETIPVPAAVETARMPASPPSSISLPPPWGELLEQLREVPGGLPAVLGGAVALAALFLAVLVWALVF